MARKCILVGMDGANPRFVLGMMRKGKLPNFQRMMSEGTFAPHCYSSVPTSTPENWTTIATGAWNGTHQVMSFQTFQPPELHGGWMAGYTSKESQAEFIWDALERAGKRTILLKYPASHPPTMATGVQVCGCHVRPCAHQIDGAHVFSTTERGNASLHLKPRDANGALPVLYGKMTLEARGIGGRPLELDERTKLYGVPDSDGGGVGLGNVVCKLTPPGKVYHVLVESGDNTNYDHVKISRDPAGNDLLADLSPAVWSDWILDSFDTIDGKRHGSLRFRLEEISPDGRIVRIYATQIMDVDHFAFPESVSRELFEKCGPFITDIGWDGLGHDASRGQALFNESVMVDLAKHQHDWFAKAVDYLGRTRPWDLMMLQAHCIDCANHHCLNLADPVSNPDPASRARYLDFIEALYESLDAMLGRIIDGADEDTVVIAVSDHGGLAGHLKVDTGEVLRDAGLLSLKEDGETDWGRSKAYITGGLFVNVNLRGRENHGIVEAEDYELACDQIKAALHACVDPRTGLHPYNMVLRKSDMRYLGLYGDPGNSNIGDIVFTLREPFGGTHGEQLSTAAFGLGSNGSILVMWGPGIRRGAKLERTVWLTDIVPTICHILGAPVPKDAQGAIVYQALE